MNALKDYVNWKLTHADKVAEAEEYPLVLENCKKNKRMKQLEVYGNSVQDGTPTPENSIEVQSVGEKSVNLFDVNTYPLTVGKVIFGHNGELGNVSGYAATVTYIPCTDLQGKTITINHTKGANVGMAFYDESKVYISGVRYQNATSITVTVPENAIYYRFSVDVNYIDEIQVQEGATATPYEPYGKYKASIVQRGINLLPDARDIYNGNGADDSETANGYVEVIEDGRECVRFTSASRSKLTKINFKENTQYTFSFDCKCVKRSGYTSYPSYDIPLAIYYTNGNQRIMTIPNDGEWRRLTFTTSASLSISHIGTYYYDYRAYLYVDINSFQINEGADTPYEPYVEPVTTNIFLNEPIRKIGDYADYIDFKGEKVVRNIGKHTYDGTETWGLSWAWGTNGMYCANLKNMKPWGTTLGALSTHFKSYNDTVATALHNEWVIGNSSTVFANDNCLTVEEFKTWLSENNVTVIYPLATPTEETIECDLPKLNAKTNIIEVDTSLAPSNIYGKYIKK